MGEFGYAGVSRVAPVRERDWGNGRQHCLQRDFSYDLHCAPCTGNYLQMRAVEFSVWNQAVRNRSRLRALDKAGSAGGNPVIPLRKRVAGAKLLQT